MFEIRLSSGERILILIFSDNIVLLAVSKVELGKVLNSLEKFLREAFGTKSIKSKEKL